MNGNVTEDGELLPMVAEQNMIGLLNKSEIDQQIATAKKYPRSVVKFRKDALEMVTLNERVAESCIYALPRDGKTIEGPSARFAEIIVSAWGNCRSGARVVSDQGDFVTAQGVFHDLERNSAITFEVQRRITGKGGKRYGADMIGVTANAACSIGLRNAILKGVPKAFWDDLYIAARQTIMGDFKTLNNRRADALAKFQAYGVSNEQVCATLDVAGVEDIGLDELVTMRGLLTALREGDTTPEMAFATPENGNKPPVKAPQSKSEQGRAAAAAQQGPQEGPHTQQPQLKQEPHRETEQPPAPKDSNADGPLASEGSRNWLLTKLKQRGMTIDDAYRSAGLTVGAPLTVDRFTALKDMLAQAVESHA